MNTTRAINPAKKPFIITKSTEQILKTIHFCRFATAQDVCRVHYSPGSVSHVREILSNLATTNYLYRFELPHISRGNTEKIYTLGSKGRDFLTNELGLPVDWYFRPYKVKHFSYSQVLHNLVLTRWLVAAHSWCAKELNFRISQTRICYELAKTPAVVEVAREGKIEKLKVIPDAWIEFERLKNGEHEHYLPIMLEIDRGSKHSIRFKRDVHNRIAFIKSGAYRKLFQAEAVMIAYVTTGDQYRDIRRRAMCAWTQEVLADLHMENWSNIFRIASVEFDQLYTTPMFDEPVWYRPGSPTPIPLFTS
jgi:hypothetical protein